MESVHSTINMPESLVLRYLELRNLDTICLLESLICMPIQSLQNSGLFYVISQPHEDLLLMIMHVQSDRS